MRNIEAYKGDDLKIEVYITNDLGEAEDLTGGSLQLMVKHLPTDDDDLAVFNETVTEFNAPTTGAQYFLIPTEDLEVWQYVAQVKYIDASVMNNFSDTFKLKINQRIFE